MIQPTQDTDITSSISPLFHICDDEPREKLRTKNNVTKLVQGRRSTSFVMETVHLDERESELDGGAKSRDSELLKSLGENFPWLVKFSKVIQSSVGSKNVELLDRLLSVYIENISRDVNTCYTKPYRAAKLKTHISETLMFFHLYWRNIKERVDDHNQYLDKMSEILAMYVDMELKASRRGKDSAPKIAAKLLTAMFIYLDNSEEHIFRVLFRVKFVTKNYSYICDPIFTKLFTGISGSQKIITDVTYVRYLLALKLWKKIKDDAQEKKKINELGLAILGQRTPAMNPKLAKFIPKPPDCQKNSTPWLLQPNSFDLRKACDCFIYHELSEHIPTLPDSIERFEVMDSTDVVLPSTQLNVKPDDRLQEVEKPRTVEIFDSSQQLRKVVKLRKFKPSFPKLRPGEVVFIDLTAENEENKQRDVKKKKKKDKKKLKWLKEVRKKSRVKKKVELADKTWVEKSVAHSTKDNDKEMKIIENNRPISEDKITESTERIESTAVNGHRYEKTDCDTTCVGCKFCNPIGKVKYNDEQGMIDSSENFVTSQTSPIDSDATPLTNNTAFIDKQLYDNSESFGEARSCENLINRIKQEPKEMVNYIPRNMSESRSFFYSNDQFEGRETVKMVKHELRDSTDDTITEKHCDKMILTDSSSFNINRDEDRVERSASIPTVKLGAENSTQANASFPSKSQSQTRGKLSKMKDHDNETCVVSTTASIAEFSVGEQINIVSGSTSEILESNLRIGNCNLRRGSDTNANNDPESSDKETAINSKKLTAASKQKKSGNEGSNFSENAAEETVNNKLQHSLINALSLDEIVQIGRDDVDSQSEDEKEKGYRGKMVNDAVAENFLKKSNSTDDENDFFQMPDIQLCDNITSDNEIGNLATSGGKSKIDEFENIDILDSILNGDMSMQDILEEHQHLPMSSAGLDTSANMLGFFTEFFRESEVAQLAEKNCPMDQTSHLDEIAESLPEGSLGTTGILNSLLDSDLTSIDSPPSDFMYSNVQTVNPRLIRKSPTAERAGFMNGFDTASDLFSPNEQSSVDNFCPADSLSKRTKDQLFLDQKDSLNCTDLEEFGLNSAKQTNFEMPVLEEELIQLSQHPLIDETIITQISPRACESPSSASSEVENLVAGESAPLPDFNGVQLPKNNHNYSKLKNVLRFKDVVQNSSNEINHGEDLPTSTLTDFTPPQSVDPPKSPYTFASSPAPVHGQTVSHSPTHSMGTSHHPASSNVLTSPANKRQNNLTPPSTPQQGQNRFGKSHVGQKSQMKYSSMKLQSHLSAGVEDDFVLSVQKGETCETGRRKSREKVTYVVRSKKNAKTRARSGEATALSADHNDREESMRLAQVQVALTRLTAEQINAKANGEQSVLKSQIVKTGADTPFNTVLQTPQLQRIDLRKFGIATQPNKSVLINLNGKTKPALVFERNAQSDKLLKSFHNDLATRGNVVYKLTSNLNPVNSKEKPYTKLPKVNFKQTAKSELTLFAESPPSSVTGRCDSFDETSKDLQIQKMIKPRSSTRCVKGKVQASKSTKDMNVRKTLAVPTAEEPSLKKRKIAAKLMPLLENEGILYTVNQQKAQEKHPNVIRREFTRKDRTRRKVV